MSTNDTIPNPVEAMKEWEERVPFLKQDLSRMGIPSVDFCGMQIDNLSLDKALRSICIRVSQGRPGYIVTPNVDHLCQFCRNPEFKGAYDKAFLSLLDSKPMFWVGRLLGISFRAKLSGSDMVYHMAQFASEKGFSLFLLGAAEGVADKAAVILTQRYPGLKIAGTYSPPLRFEENPAENEDVLRRLREAKPDMCFVALGSPRQEYWMHHNYEAAGVPAMIGVGAGLDFVAGTQARAPALFQRLGLEWFWRLCSQPRRLWHRYLVDDALFYGLIYRALVNRIRQRFSRRVRPGQAP